MNIFYVVGSPRSGSTFIYNAICSNDYFNYALPENHLVPSLVNFFINQIQRNQEIEKNKIFNSNEDIKAYFNDCLDKFFKKISKKYNSKNLILKSILFGPDIHFMDVLYPKVSYVMTVRDPKDIIASMINISNKQKKYNKNIQYPRDVKKLCEFVNHKYRVLFNPNQKKFIQEKIFCIKYEDFIKNPKLILNNFAKKFSLNIDYSNEDNFWKRNIMNEKNTKFNEDQTNFYLDYESDLWGKPASKSRIGVFKDLLSMQEINAINLHCKRIIDFFNY